MTWFVAFRFQSCNLFRQLAAALYSWQILHLCAATTQQGAFKNHALWIKRLPPLLFSPYLTSSFHSQWKLIQQVSEVIYNNPTSQESIVWKEQVQSLQECSIHKREHFSVCLLVKLFHSSLHIILQSYCTGCHCDAIEECKWYLSVW